MAAQPSRRRRIGLEVVAVVMALVVLAGLLSAAADGRLRAMLGCFFNGSFYRPARRPYPGNPPAMTVCSRDQRASPAARN